MTIIKILLSLIIAIQLFTVYLIHKKRKVNIKWDKPKKLEFIKNERN